MQDFLSFCIAPPGTNTEESPGPDDWIIPAKSLPPDELAPLIVRILNTLPPRRIFFPLGQMHNERPTDEPAMHNTLDWLDNLRTAVETLDANNQAKH